MRPSIRRVCLIAGATLLASTAMGQDPVMRLDGQCPGAISLEVTGATPNGIIAILIGFQTGMGRIPAGPCQGTTLGLAMRGLRLAGVAHADSDGQLMVTHKVGRAACGQYLQALDGSTCSTSNVVQIN